MKLFETQPVNTGRQIEADFAKAVCLVGMVLVHAFEELGKFFPNVTGTRTGLAYIFVIVLDAVFGAATFMFCMGFGVAYTPKNDAASLIKRGAKLLLFGYLLNIARDGIPYLLNLLISGNDALCQGLLRMLLYCDILQFAGLALMLFGLLKKWKLSDPALVTVALVMSAIGSLFRNFDCGELLHIQNDALCMTVNQLVGLFFGTVFAAEPEATYNCFPLMNWFIFVVAGYLFGKALRRCSNKGAFYARVSVPGAVIVIAYLLIAIPNRLGMMSENLNMYYHLTTPEALLCIASAITVFGMYYALSRILPAAMSRFALHISKSLTRIYIVHWILIGFSVTGIITALQLAGYTQMPAANDLQTVLFGVLVLIASVIISELIGRCKKRKERAEC